MNFETLLSGAVGVLLILNVFLINRSGASVGFVSVLFILSGQMNVRVYLVSGVGLRLAGLSLLVILAMVHALKDSKGRERGDLPPGYIVVGIFGAVVNAFIAASSGFSVSSLISLVGYVAVVMLLGLVFSSDDDGEIVRGMMLGLQAVVWLCFLLFIASGAPLSRFSGVFVNANTLGFFAAALGVWLLVQNHRTGAQTFSLAVVALLVVVSGSRSSAGALGLVVVILVVRAFGQRGRRTFLIVAVTVPLVGYLVVSFLSIDIASGLFRTVNSRANGNYYALHVAQWRWGSGLGYKAESVEVASTPLRVLVEGGLLAAGVGVAGYLLILLRAGRTSLAALAVAGFGISNSLLEGWFYVATSGLFIIFWSMAAGAAKVAQDPLHSRGAHATANSSLQSHEHVRSRLPGRLPQSRKPLARVGRY